MELSPLFRGRLVRLAAPMPDDAQQFAEWSNNDEYLRMADDDPARPVSAETFAAWENQFINAPHNFVFRIRTLEDDKLIGVIALNRVHWMHRTGILGMSIGDPAYWGKGYGSDAIQLILGYAFRELDLYRVSLSVIGYNTRAIRAYEKAGFQHEGAERGAIQREGQRFDLILMGILRSEWAAQP